MKIRHEILIILLSIAFLIPLAANPGFFNNDELQITDYIYRTGFWQFIKDFGMFHVGSQFSVPSRPFAFIIQGIQGLFMYNAPLVSHFIDIIIHIACALVLFRVIVYISKNKNFAFISSVIFIISPLVLFSVGWTAALMDRLYTLFSLIIVYYSFKYLNREGLDQKNLLIILVAIFLAIASKETSIIIPALVFLTILWNNFDEKIKIFRKRNIVLFLFSLVPIVLYIIYRLPSLIGSFSVVSGPYVPSFSNIIPNALAYWSYPFLPFTAEATNMFLLTNKYLIGAAFILHALLALFIFKECKYKNGIFYILLYFLPLAPIIMLPSQQSIYLYASAAVFSVAIAFLFIKTYEQKFKITYLFFLSLMIGVVLIIHAYSIEKNLYSYGVCMNKALVSMESVYLHNNKINSLVIHSDKGAPKYIMDRITYQRINIEKYFPVTLKSVGDHLNSQSYIDNDSIHLHFSASCYVY